jgi:1,4-dihydroxy-2-naphthoate octaprenyltransferase
VQVGAIDSAAWIAAAAIGLHAAGVLLVNNYRDRGHDASTGRRTLPVVIGVTASLRLFTALAIVPFALAALLTWQQRALPYALPLAALPWSLRLVRDFARTPDGPAWNALLFRTVMLEVAFGMLLAAGALLAA